MTESRCVAWDAMAVLGDGHARIVMRRRERRAGATTNEILAPTAVGRRDREVLPIGRVHARMADDLEPGGVGNRRNSLARGEAADPVDIGLEDVDDTVPR